jgi:AsmA family protein
VDEPYSFDADVLAGKTRGTATGAFQKPFDVASLTADLQVQGENLAHLYYLTGLALPFTPPYRLNVTLRSADQLVQLEKIDGRVGQSDIAGRASIDLTGERPKFVAQLTSKSLNLVDLSPAFGKGIPVDPDTGKARDSVAPGALPADKLLPTYEFEFDRLRTMDAELKLSAASIQTDKVPMEGVEINLRLDDGVLELNPVVFELPQGKMAGAVYIDARQAQAKTKMDVRLSNVKLDQFKGKDATTAPLNGVLHARAQLTGVGNSVREFAANADGQLSGVIPSGEIRKAFAELTGINVARGLGLLLTGSQERADVRCGAATFRVEDGEAHAEQIVVDTDSVLIEGDGTVHLGSETLDLEILGKPKKLRLVRLRAPVTLTGTLRKPDIGVDAGDAAKQVGIAGIVGAIFSPLTAALAFIDPGLAKDANCAALLAEAEEAMAKTQASGQAPRQASGGATKSSSGK